MDLINEDSFIFQWMEMAMNSDNLYHQVVNCMIYVNSDGIYATDLWDTYLEKKIARDDFLEFLTFPLDTVSVTVLETPIKKPDCLIMAILSSM